ncbi:MAG: hypothetical protein IJ867_00900 [Clostridia bacterium]|nr:hypothetical protein [Clostridia bacterium]
MEKELLKLKRVFSPKYILTEKLAEVYLFFILLIGLCFASRRIGYGILMIFLLVLIVFFKLVFEKRKSNQTVMKFYEDRVEFKGKMFLWKVEERSLKYEEIKDIMFSQGTTFFEKRFQKAFGYGNIYIYPKKGTFLTNGMQIELVENINEKVEEIKNIVGDKLG